ncbi:LexA family protein [Xanthomonas arboricola]|uniref:LexA family protein n=1 Tax=Xanthomonas arboricola TaxID=56448 RepID=UPI00141AD17D|nr:hypothetical protein [Xanthomonas arboricola]NIK52030.1 DNA-binding MarR family transcriptional regulator [Xanthomonas arboricola]
MSRVRGRTQEILAFIHSRIDAEGLPPTLEEIAKACGFKSRSAVQKHVRSLEASGELQVTPGQARSARPKRAKEQAAGAATFFEVIPRDINDLTDTDLRALVARLCIAGLADAGLPPTSVIWGGDQRAPDGGIDVRVQTLPSQNLAAPLDRGSVGIQVKATRMGSAEIQREMCPGGVLRPSICDLIGAHGTYIIVASDLIADEEYRRRVAAMKAAAMSVPNASDAMFDYYDARRLADWSNQYPGVVAWVRSRLGRPLQGWQAFGSWASPALGATAFFADEKLRVSDPLDREHKLSLVEGLGQVRRTLLNGGHSVRLTGLSGVGKTRFAQALFEESALHEALPEELAVYTDIAHSPTPAPLAVLDQLLVARRRAILIVDNCGPQLHNQLSARCKTSNRVSLLTIEYDIREELASETNVFHLEAGSDDLIENIIAQQFPHISQVNQRTIARFSDGNSRVAIALALTMERHDSLAGLNDDELFDRLFWLGKDINNELRVAAEACSLVYSFDVEDVEGELAQLASLADIKPLAMFRHVSDLEQRGLAQRRGRWRAILPHAFANRLAARALTSIPTRLVERYLVEGEERLLKSFSRRLGYLHKSPTALAFVHSWLEPGGLLGDLSDLNPLHLDVLENIAPVSPAATLDAIKRAIEGTHGEKLLGPSSFARSNLVQIIRLIAFDPTLFDPCIKLLVRFALAEPKENRSNSTRDVIKSLFQIHLSGTHASTEQRAAQVTALIESEHDDIRAVGLDALSAALECYHLSSHYPFDFGARVRDYGAYPRGVDAQHWIRTFIFVAVNAATTGGPMAEMARNELALRFRTLWAFAEALEPLEAATAALLPGGWERGWLAMRQTLRFDGKKGMRQDSYARLVRLEERSRPTTLIGRVKAIVLSSHSAGADYSDGESASKGYKRADRLARELGELVVVDEEIFAQIAPLVVANVQGRQWHFGEGLAATTPSPEATWAELVVAFEKTPVGERNVQVLRGFLHTTCERDRDLFNRFLDESMTRPSLIEWVPVLQLSAKLDDRGCDRMLASMTNPSVPAWVFRHLSFGSVTELLPESRLAEILERLSIKPSGLEVAIDILHMHIHGEKKPIGPKLTACARTLIANAPLTRHDHSLDYALGRLIERFLVGADAQESAHRILVRIQKAIDEYTISRYDFNESLKALFGVQPILALDVLIGEDGDQAKGRARRNALAGGRRSSALSAVPEDALLEWCRSDAQRWVQVAPLVPAFDTQSPDTELQWSVPVKALLLNAHDPEAVAGMLIDALIPMSWSGSRADIIRQRLPLLDQLSRLLGPGHDEQVITWKQSITEVMDREARRELEEHRSRDERFE